MSNLDKKKITQKMSLILDNLTKLKYLKKLSKEEFILDFRNIESAKHLLQVTIEAMHDIANHIVSRRRLGKPESYSDAFRILTEKKLIPQRSSEVYITMMKFRNRIVHLYHQVDNEEIYDILQSNLHDFTIFLEEIRQIINK